MHSIVALEVTHCLKEDKARASSYVIHRKLCKKGYPVLSRSRSAALYAPPARALTKAKSIVSLQSECRFDT